MESADRCLDHEESEMQDWEFIQNAVLSGRYVMFLGQISKIKCVSWLFERRLFESFSFATDVCVNFIEAHEEA